MNEPLVYISLTKGKDRLVIDGSFDLLKNFMTTFTQGEACTTATVCNPVPQVDDLTAKARHG